MCTCKQNTTNDKCDACQAGFYGLVNNRSCQCKWSKDGLYKWRILGFGGGSDISPFHFPILLSYCFFILQFHLSTLLYTLPFIHLTTLSLIYPRTLPLFHLTTLHSFTLPPFHSLPTRTPVCGCDPLGTVRERLYECDAVTGQCFCMPSVVGRRCNVCKSLHYSATEILNCVR